MKTFSVFFSILKVVIFYFLFNINLLDAKEVVLENKEILLLENFSENEVPNEILNPNQYTWQQISDDYFFDSEKTGKHFIIRFKAPDLSNYQTPALHIRKNGFAMTIFSHQKKVFHFAGKEQFEPGQFLGWPTHVVKLHHKDIDNYFYFVVYTEMSLLFPKVSIEEEGDLIKNLFVENLPSYFTVAISYFLGIGFLIAYTVRRNDNIYLSLFLFFISIGTWLFNINPIANYIIPYSPTRLKVEYFSLYLAPIGALLFLESIIYSRTEIVIRYIRYFYMAYIPIAFGLDLLRIYPLWKTLIPFDLTLLFFALLYICIIIYNTLKGKWEARILFFGIIALVFFAIHDVLVVIGAFGLFSTLKMHWGVLSFILAMSGVAIYRIYLMNWHMKRYSQELEEKNIILKMMNEEKEELNQTLEIKVVERTQEIYEMMEKVKELKIQQDADYFLTSLIEKPLCKIINESEKVSLDTYTRQKKDFEFRGKKWELGGDIIIASNLFFGTPNDRYVFFFNGDAMGKSMQGAGGAIVAGTAINNILNRSLESGEPLQRNPPNWLRDVHKELDAIFRTFDGCMLLSCTLGLVRESTGEVFFFNAEHPYTILFRDGNAMFVEKNIYLYKLGAGIRREFYCESLQLRPDDSLFIGSDGKDDIEILENNTFYKINQDENMILRIVEEANGQLDRIVEILEKKGRLTDDLSLLKIQFKG